MKAKINPDLCIGCGLCTDMCPLLFQMKGDVAKPCADPIPPKEETAAREAAEACPVEAIDIDE